MDLFKKRSRVVSTTGAGGAAAAPATAGPVLSIRTSDLLEGSTPYERLATSGTSPTKPSSPLPPLPTYAGDTDNFSSASSRRSQNGSGSAADSYRMSAASSRPQTPVYTGHASITPPVNLIAKLVSPGRSSGEVAREDAERRAKQRDSRRRSEDTEAGNRQSGRSSPGEGSMRSVQSGPSRYDDRGGRRTPSMADSVSTRASVASASARSSPKKGYASGTPGFYATGSTAGDTGWGSPSPTLSSVSTLQSQPSALPRSPYANNTSRRPSTLHSYDTSSSLDSVASSSTLVYISPPTSATFEFPRPPPHVISQRFNELLPKLDFPRDAIQSLGIDRQWTLLYNDEHSKWTAAREQLTGKAVDRRSAMLSNMAVGGSSGDSSLRGAGKGMKGVKGMTENPEWYISKFMDSSITKEEVTGLSVCLRTYSIEFLHHFIALRGQAVLGSALYKLNRVESHHQLSNPLHGGLEAEIVKCLKTLFNHSAGTHDAIDHNASMPAIAASLTSPNIVTRKMAAELLVFFVSRGDERGRNLVLGALDDLARSRKVAGRFDTWFKYWEEAIDGRGTMGSRVGASDAVRSLRGGDGAQLSTNGDSSYGQLDGQLMDYAVHNVLLVQTLLQRGDLAERVRIRADMESSGLRRILGKHSIFGNINSSHALRRGISKFEADANHDEAELAESIRDDAMNFSDLEAVLDALKEGTDGRAREYLTAAMKQLLLVPQDPEARLRIFQLLSQIVTAIVTGKKGLDGDFTSIFGASVTSVISKYDDEDRLEKALDELADAKGAVVRLRKDREGLREELSLMDDGLVARLKSRIEELEQALVTSRGATEALRGQLASTERSHRDEMRSHDLKFQELYTMYQEMHGLDNSMGDDEPNLDRRELLASTEKRMHRIQAIKKLEGPSKRGTRDIGGEELVEVEVTSPRKSRFEDAMNDAVVTLAPPPRPVSPQSSRTPTRPPTGQSSSPSAPKRGGHPSFLDDLVAPPMDTRGSSSSSTFSGLPPLSFQEDQPFKTAPSTPQPSAPTSPEESIVSLPSLPTLIAAVSPTTSYPAPPPAPPPPAYIPGVAPPREPPSSPRPPPRSFLADIVRPKAPSPKPQGPPPPPPPPPPPYVAGDAPPRTLVAGTPLPSAAPSPSRPVFSLGALSAGKGGLRPAGNRVVRPPGPGPVPPPPPPAVPGAPAGPFGGAAMRKKPFITPDRPMKQLQWDKVDAETVANTVWGLASKDGSEFSRKLQQRGVYGELEDDFRAKQFVTITAKREKKALVTILNPTRIQRLEIWLRKGSKGSLNDELNVKIESIVTMILRCDSAMDQDFCTELHGTLPDPKEEGQLNTHRQTSLAELDFMEPADRYLVELLKIYRVRDRVAGLLYRAKFEETIKGLEEITLQIFEAAQSLIKAPRFVELLKLILDLGNFMNAGGHKGGAHGFKITSINKLVDSKSSKGGDRTLLHFTAGVVTEKMLELEGFTDELELAAAASRADLSHVRLQLGELRTSQEQLDTNLKHFVDLDDNPDDAFARQMVPFAKRARERLARLVDQITSTEGAYAAALKFYCENPRDIASTQDFFGVFRTFVTSYRKARSDNALAADRAAKTARAAALKAEAAAAALIAAEGNQNLVEDSVRGLMNFESTRAERRKQAAAPTGVANPATDIWDVARSMLAEFHPDESSAPTAAVPAVPARRSRPREGRRGGSETNGLPSVEEDPRPRDMAMSPVNIVVGGEEEEGE